jgi:hypothetical protein
MNAEPGDLQSFTARMMAAKERLSKAAQKADLVGDPMADVLEGEVALAEAFEAGVLAMREAVRTGAQNQLDDKAPALFVAEAVKELPYAIRNAAGGFVAEEVRKQARRWTWQNGAALLLAAIVGALVMWWVADERVQRAERRVTEITSEIHETEDGLRAAFADAGPEGAAYWLNFMRWNDVRFVARSCAQHRSVLDGRAACQPVLWNAPPKPTAPEGKTP